MHLCKPNAIVLIMLVPACFFLSQACVQPNVGNESAVAVMLDFSKTFAPYDAQDVAAITQINRSIVGAIKSGWLPQPVKVVVAGFGDQGLLPVEPCGPPVVFAQKLTAPPKPTPEMKVSTDINEFEAWLTECAKVLKAASTTAQQYTDVSGALAFAAGATRDAKATKLVVVYTDLLEDLPVSREHSSYDLSGDDVLVVWRPGLDDRKQPVEVQRRVAAARKAYKQQGALRVCDSAAQTITSGDVLGCFAK